MVFWVTFWSPNGGGVIDAYESEAKAHSEIEQHLVRVLLEYLGKPAPGVSSFGLLFLTVKAGKLPATPYSAFRGRWIEMDSRD